ncbi:hypothetical protein [Ktedonobacter robiniae]|uniref:Uncharacterized protein n=1 Tax=Ktedonobacter robiniae TaxID=2778365 RepID=A0ABQ3V1C4_9CHLR|nr:hypothetical protein [Ktedonobacter robiniae]GHO58934.1 hypothetical protein KSB_74090 [Ktedonobacter robiniae]
MNTVTNADRTEQQNSPKKARRHFLPALVLLVLTPCVSELLLGDMKPNSSFLFLFLFNMAYYGTGALAIRELVRRRGLSWYWIPILAFAYGLVEEGLVLHSLFNPNFPGLGALGSYGRFGGVDWVWASFVLGLHTVWSISIPILVTELLFPQHRTERWLGNIAFCINCFILVLALALLTLFYATYITPGFQAPPVGLLVTAVMVLMILVCALLVPVQKMAQSARDVVNAAPTPWIVGISAFLLAMAFLFLHEILKLTLGIPAAVLFLLHIVVGVIAAISILRWSAHNSRWTDQHRVALAFSALLGYCCIGFEVVSPDALNLAFHGAISAITIVLMILLTLRIQRRLKQVS